MTRGRLAPLVLAAVLAACTGTVALKYDPKETPLVLTDAAGLTIHIEAVQDEGMGIMMRSGMTPMRSARPLDEVVREALATELGRIGFTITDAREKADAVLRATIVSTSLEWPTQGFSVPYRGAMRLKASLLSPRDGRIFWQTETVGNAEVRGSGGGYAGSKPELVLNGALAASVGRFGANLSNDNVVAQIRSGAAPSARPESPARAAAASDVDALPEAGPVSRRVHAVVIGIERYREDLPKADFAAGDARLFAEYAKRVLGAAEGEVAVLLNDRAARTDLEKYLERWLPNHVAQGDDVFVYFSGHGAPDPATGKSYLVPYDGDPAYLHETAYPIERLYQQLAKLPAKNVYVVLDSCFSGAGGRSVIAKGARPLVNVAQGELPAKLTVLAASAGDQASQSYQEKGHGLFTYFLLKGLKEKGADLRVVFDYLKSEVSRVARREYNADQDPQWRQGK